MALRWWCDPACGLQSQSVWESIGRCGVRYKLACSCHSPCSHRLKSERRLEMESNTPRKGKVWGRKIAKRSVIFFGATYETQFMCLKVWKKCVFPTFPIFFTYKLAHFISCLFSLSLYIFIISPGSCPLLLNGLPLLSSNKPASFCAIFPSSALCFTLWHV